MLGPDATAWFLCSWASEHGVLRSFPTRRSSDLSVDVALSRVAAAPPSRGARVAWGRGHAAAARSEEHTSELQSRLHLVCRLLLEKKKKAQPLTNTPSIEQWRVRHDSALRGERRE